jgi:hypothetical protein
MSMRSFALIEDDKAAMIYVRPSGNVTVFDQGRPALRCRIDIRTADTKWTGHFWRR